MKQTPIKKSLVMTALILLLPAAAVWSATDGNMPGSGCTSKDLKCANGTGHVDTPDHADAAQCGVSKDYKGIHGQEIVYSVYNDAAGKQHLTYGCCTKDGDFRSVELKTDAEKESFKKNCLEPTDSSGGDESLPF